MPTPLAATRIRFSSDQVLNRDNALTLTDKITGLQIQMWQSEDSQIETSLFSNGTFIDSYANITSITLQFKDPGNLLGSPLFSKTITIAGGAPAYDATCTLTDWNAGTKQTFAFALAAADTNIALDGRPSRTLQLDMWVTSTTSQRIMVCSGILTLVDSGYGDIGSIVIVAPGARMKSNLLQVINSDNSLYYNVRLRNVSGVPTLTTDGAGEA
jgi:hypothetical protein